MTGTFLSKVFDGPFNAVPKYIKEMDKYVSGQGEKVKKILFSLHHLPQMRQNIRAQLHRGLRGNRIAEIWGQNFSMCAQHN